VKIASTTLTGNNSAIIAEALASAVEWVDICLVIDTGVTDDTLEVARRVAGDKYRCRRFPWIDDFAAARNFALEAAAAEGADWAVTLDTDERMELGNVDLRAVLESARNDVFMMFSSNDEYAKERCFRLPAKERFEGPTHEAYPAYRGTVATLAGVRFRELEKSAHALRRKFERDREILVRHVQAHPKDPRWHYYLGESLKNLGRLEEAVAAYDACAKLRGWNEESAWACYRAAECLSRLQRHQEAVDRCAQGLARHAGIAELPWLAGFCSYQLRDYAQASYWARLAVTHGLFQGSGPGVQRIGFRNQDALYEGPFDILRYALRQLGDTQGAEAAEQAYQAARAARLGRAGLRG
jgi:tetratricopeptide (TPR) repeat protein